MPNGKGFLTPVSARPQDAADMVVETDIDEVRQWIAAGRDGNSDTQGRLFERCRNYLLLVAERELDPLNHAGQAVRRYWQVIQLRNSERKAFDEIGGLMEARPRFVA